MLRIKRSVQAQYNTQVCVKLISLPVAWLFLREMSSVPCDIIFLSPPPPLFSPRWTLCLLKCWQPLQKTSLFLPVHKHLNNTLIALL
jgi:hypothetical protein